MSAVLRLSAPVRFALLVVAALVLGTLVDRLVPQDVALPWLFAVYAVAETVLAVVLVRTAARLCRVFGTPLKLFRVYRRRDRFNHDHYVAFQFLGGAGYTSFNWITRSLQQTRHVYVDRDGNASTTYRYNCDVRYMVDAYNWRDAADVAWRMFLGRLLVGRTLTVYLPGHIRSASPSHPGFRGWRMTFTNNWNNA